MAADDDQQERDPVLCNRRIDGPYTVLPNRIVQGSDLTPDEFRLLAYVASLPSDWNLRIPQAAKRCGMSPELAYKALNGLVGRDLARHVTKVVRGKIAAGWWEFTLTPGQWKEAPEKEGEDGGRLFVNFRKRRKKPFLDSPNKVSPFTADPTLQRFVSHKGKTPKNPESDQDADATASVVVTDGAGSGHTVPKPATAPAERRMGSPMEELPERWPFPDDADATRRVRNHGMEPEAVWRRFRERWLAGKIPQPPDNLGGYLVAIAKRMAREALGPADPSTLAQARRDLGRRGRR